MNTSALKTFAPAVRRQLMEAVTRKLDVALTAQTPDYLTTFAPQVAALRKLAQADRAGLIERVAYTWFNRLAALRFMDARGWHPFRARVLTPASAAETQPELLRLTRSGALPEELKSYTDPQRLNDLLDGRIPSPDAQGEVYRHLVLAACRFYHVLLPNLFEKLDDETELLLPDDLLTEHSVVHGFRTEISDEDCGDGQRANVEILGWLYQFYISERKDQVMARKSAVPTEDIPAVTQLFTPHWIVRYLVENSLGRLWLLNRPQSRLRDHMPYYIEPAPAEPPAWQADWQHRIQFTEHDFKTWMWLRPNASLQGDYDATLWYAMTIDGQAYGRTRWGIETFDGSGGDKVEELILAGLDKAGFEDLRYCLFVVQRGIKWLGGGGPVDDLIEKFHAVHAALCKAWDREWSGHTTDLPDLSHVGVTAESPETDFLKITKPEEIRLCDPAVGSGHMLTYAFDLLSHIYEEEGYAPTEIPGLILRHNLQGVEICPRAAQLAELALVFKAREKSRRFFQPEHLVRPHIIELRDVRFAENELRDYIQDLALGDLFNQPMLRLLHQFEEAKNFGSLIQPCLDERAIADVRRAIEAKDLGGQLFLRETHLKVLRVLEQAEALTQRYHVIVANPPYMGTMQMNARFKTFAAEKYPNSKSDAFAMFIERGFSLTQQSGLSAMVTMESWMFLSSHEDLRERVLNSAMITAMVHMPYLGRGGTSMGINFGTSATIFLNAAHPKRTGHFQCIRYFECDERGVPVQFPTPNERLSRACSTDFGNIPGKPLVYYASKRVLSLFATNRNIDAIADPCAGLTTGDNEKFQRIWTEVEWKNIGIGCTTELETVTRQARWYPCISGGPARAWYGNHDTVVEWRNAGDAIRNFRDANGKRRSSPRSSDRYFSPGVTWNKIGSGRFAARQFPSGFIFDDTGQSCFAEGDLDLEDLTALMCSVTSRFFLSLLSVTLSFNKGDIARIPVPSGLTGLGKLSRPAVEIAKSDWDNFETSWDFRDQPLLRPGQKGATLEASWRNWEAQSTAAIRRMQELETENNRLFIAAYGLEGELQPEVPEEQITLARAETRRDMAAFLSYAVGCMMGRYGLDHPGLILANAGDTLREFLEKVGKPLAELTFAPDEDGIIPVLDGEWFEDDIVARTRDFLRATFGEATLRENLRFLEDSLGKDLRKYFLNDFYKDHLQTYKKRPIYWLVQSPKKGFSALIYLHRYTRDTMNLVLNRYLRDYQVKLRNRISHLTQEQATATTAKAKTEARKETDKLTKTLHECEEWERQTLLPLAQARIELDLDDGVKANYLKLGEALAPIAGLAAKGEE